MERVRTNEDCCRCDATESAIQAKKCMRLRVFVKNMRVVIDARTANLI